MAVIDFGKPGGITSADFESFDAGNCENLKAVNLALVQSETVSSDSDSSGMGGSSSELLSSPLSSLISLNLSNCPMLDRVGYALDSGSENMFGGLGGGSMFGMGSGSNIPKGYKTHTVINSSQKQNNIPSLRYVLLKLSGLQHDANDNGR